VRLVLPPKIIVLTRVTRSIYMVHDEAKDKDFELEMTWVSATETNGKHMHVPQELLAEAERLAKEKMDEEMED
jgi:20S proteasome subunit alpha 7